MEKVQISTEWIKLDQAMKLSGAVMTGGEAKWLIEDSCVSVNDEVCTLRGKKLHAGDRFSILDKDGSRYDYIIEG